MVLIKLIKILKQIVSFWIVFLLYFCLKFMISLINTILTSTISSIIALLKILPSRATTPCKGLEECLLLLGSEQPALPAPILNLCPQGSCSANVAKPPRTLQKVALSQQPLPCLRVGHHVTRESNRSGRQCQGSSARAPAKHGRGLACPAVQVVLPVRSLRCHGGSIGITESSARGRVC